MYDPNNKEDKIKEVQDALYSKTTDAIFAKRRHPLQEKANLKEPSAWNVKEEQVESNFKIPYAKILIGAFIFFVLAMVFAFSKFFMGANVVSGNNIDILISGPVSIAGGEELPLDIEVKNNNNTDLKVVDLHIEYPDGTKSAVDQSMDLKRFNQVLGDINIGQSQKLLAKSILFGEENTQKTIIVSVEYRIAGSNAVFSKEKDFTVLISSSPVNIKVSNPSEINSNQLTDFNVEVDSNSTNVVKNLILKVDYPFGFNLVSSDPKPSGSDQSVFVLGDLAPGAKRVIRVSGTVQGQNGEQRAFKFTIGNPSNSDNSVVGTTLATYLSTVSLRKSAIGLDLSVNDQSGDNINIDPGGKNLIKINWQNNLAEKIYDMSVNIKFNGQALNKSSVNVQNGFYTSSNNSIVFDKNSDSRLSTVNPSDEGNMQFDFSTIAPSSNTNLSFENSSVQLEVSVLGSRIGSDGSAQEILYSETKTLRMSSSLKLLSKGFRTQGPFENSGPFPPQVDNKTTYTITWTATDSFNNVSGAKVSATLPPNVKWEGYTSPGTESITYDQGSGNIVWNIGDIKPGATRSASFQVSVIPSITQIGTELDLLGEATISGTDAYSGARIGESRDRVTTNITSDPAYVEGIGTVVK
jgi:hypothetical protein